MADGLDQALAKIRPHTSSNLAHQKAPATLLHALEATFQEQNTEKSPTAYFAALLTTLDGTIQKEKPSGLKFGEGDILPAELYLLALVAPFTPPPVIRANITTVLSLTAPLFPLVKAHAPALRSQLSIYDPVLRALDRSQLEIQGVRQSFASILQLCIDPRPKVRKRAAEVVRDVLASPPSPLVRHPYGERVAEWALSALTEISANAIPKSKHRKSDMEGAEVAIHMLSFLRPVALKLPTSSLVPLVPVIVQLPRLGNPFLSQSAFALLSDLLSPPAHGDAELVDITSEIPHILSAVLSSPPPKSDATIAPAWMGLLASSMLALKDADADAAAANFAKVWKAVWAFLESSDAAIRRASAQSLAVLAQCLTPALIEPALKEHDAGTGEPKSTLGKTLAQVDKAFEAFAFARAMPELLSVIAALLANLRFRASYAPRSPTAAETLLLPLVVKIGDLRVKKNFEHKEAADAVLSTAMSVMGPDVLLRALPLNLEPADRQAKREPRAFLLPLLTQPHPSPLGHFISYFVPLTERMFDLQSTAEAEGRESEAKVWTVLIAQIWAGLPGYCWASPDLRESLTPAFSQMLSQLLYSQPELRPPVLRALKILVDSNTALAAQDPAQLATLPAAVRAGAPLAPAEAQQNVVFLRAQAESWLAVLFNVFGSVGREARGMVGDVISAWAAIAGETAITQAFGKIVALLKQDLAKPQTTRGAPDGGSVAAMAQDILLLLLPHLGAADAAALFELCLTPAVLAYPDNGVQKRGYKILARLVEGGKVVLDVEDVVKRLDGVAEALAAAAKKDRFLLYTQLLPLLPSTSLHVIPSLIPEAVLGTKEPSEKARNAAFDLIVAMANKMKEGGVVKRGQMEGAEDMDEDDGAMEVKASVEEYMMMVAGGLAGATPHMISATITAISRLVFEFKDEISETMHVEILTTILVFLTSTNREIVKSTLGYIKLAIHTLPADLVRPHLPQLVPALLAWSHDHKNHFKAKVRHIFERMLRRFRWEEVYGCVGGEEAGKVLVNIRKRKERAKRRRAQGGEEDDDNEAPAAKPATGNAFEDVLYGSESELEDSDDEHAPAAGPAKKKGGEFATRIRMDDDEPMDLLSGAASRLTNAQAARRKKPGQDAARFKTDEDTGKMIIDDSDEDADEAAATAAAGEDVAGTAYRESMTSADGFTRGPNGRIKFHKDTKKRRRENAEDEDVEMGDAEGGGAKERPSKRRSDVKIGKEFKSKKAGGDVKKGGVDPYAYVTLSQAAKKGNKRNRTGIAGKR
ncbi:NUC173-domain-containing protein [Dentipellis sp. KUC8613]|nr:NUC173-domain-containing protein [Dentipellis sp. KUC8613]